MNIFSSTRWAEVTQNKKSKNQDTYYQVYVSAKNFTEN